MRSLKYGRISLTALLTMALVGSCVTINVYFPAAAVEEAAGEIVDDTWGDQSGETAPEDEGVPESSLPSRFKSTTLFRMGVVPAQAQAADINVTTPAIRALKQSMQQRAAALGPFLDRGAVGIAANGHLAVRAPKKLNLKERARVTQLVEAENRDREALYVEIAKANKFDSSKVGEIRNIFARQWKNKAKVGWFIQNPQGQWSKKKP